MFGGEYFSHFKNFIKRVFLLYCDLYTIQSIRLMGAYLYCSRAFSYSVAVSPTKKSSFPWLRKKFIETLNEILAFFVEALPFFFRRKLNGPVKNILGRHTVWHGQI